MICITEQQEYCGQNLHKNRSAKTFPFAQIQRQDVLYGAYASVVQRNSTLASFKHSVKEKDTMPLQDNILTTDSELDHLTQCFSTIN